MAAFKDLSIRHKLIRINMLVSTAALLLASIGFILYELMTFRTMMAENLSTQAEIVGINTVSAILFNDPASAAETVASLRVKPNVQSAAIYTADGRIFAKYIQSKEAGVPIPEQIREQAYNYRFQGGSLFLSRPILSNGERIGTVYIQSDLGEMNARLKRYGGIVAGVLAFSLLAAYRISSKLQGMISNPILHLAQTAKTISEEKNYSVRAVADNRDEIGQLVETFNEMLAQIQMRDSALQKAYDGLEQRVMERTEKLEKEIVERRRAEDEMSRLNGSLEAANKELEAFSYSVSHDLRAPLRHIGGFMEMLKEHQGSAIDAKSRHYMATITRSVKKMAFLIDDLLVFSRMAKTEMQIGKCHFEELIREVIGDLQPEAEGRKILWKIGPLPVIDGDEKMFRQVWANMIGNALKYTRTRQEAEIEIGSRQEGNEQIFFVRDNGVGFDPRFSGKLFGVFQRLHRVDEFEGTGIGLANVRRIVHRHGGRSWAEGQVDQGAVFYFSLPNKRENLDE